MPKKPKLDEDYKEYTLAIDRKAEEEIKKIREKIKTVKEEAEKIGETLESDLSEDKSKQEKS